MLIKTVYGWKEEKKANKIHNFSEKSLHPFLVEKVFDPLVFFAKKLLFLTKTALLCVSYANEHTRVTSPCKNNLRPLILFEKPSPPHFVWKNVSASLFLGKKFSPLFCLEESLRPHRWSRAPHKVWPIPYVFRGRLKFSGYLSQVLRIIRLRKSLRPLFLVGKKSSPTFIYFSQKQP